MFSVTPVPEGGASGRKVSFSPDVDDSYRMNVIEKIKGLMDEVDTIHRKEENQLKKSQASEQFAFKQKQEKELQDFLKRQKQDAQRFDHTQVEIKNNLKERQQQETLRMFGTTNSGWNTNGASSWNNSGWNGAGTGQRRSVMNIWNQGGGSS